jgi:hypothetical protein
MDRISKAGTGQTGTPGVSPTRPRRGRRPLCRVCRQRPMIRDTGLCDELACAAVGARMLGEWAAHHPQWTADEVWRWLAQSYWGAVEIIQGAERPRNLSRPVDRAEGGRAA